MDIVVLFLVLALVIVNLSMSLAGLRGQREIRSDVRGTGHVHLLGLTSLRRQLVIARVVPRLKLDPPPAPPPPPPPPASTTRRALPAPVEEGDDPFARKTPVGTLEPPPAALFVAVEDEEPEPEHTKIHERPAHGLPLYAEPQPEQSA